MTVTPLEKRKRQKILLFVALGIVLVAVLVLYFGFWKKPAPSETTSLTPAPSGGVSAVSEERLKQINLDFEFLNEKILSFLKIHGDIPVEKGETGRDNPFNPY